MNYRSMSNMPSHGNASQSKVGNARREGFQMNPAMQQKLQHAAQQIPQHLRQMAGNYAPGMAGGKVMEMSCQFPQPPPKRCYCHPASFTSLDGRSHHRILDAYGDSRPCQSYY